MISLVSFIRSFSINFPPTAAPDIAGYVIHACPASELVNGDLVPTEDNLINKGPDTGFFYTIPENKPAGMWYVKVAAYDTFGLDELNYSDLYSINVASLDPLDQVPPNIPTWVSLTSKVEASGQVDNISITAMWALDPVPYDFNNYILAYKVTSEIDYIEVFTTETTHTLTNLIAGQPYDFKVRAVDQWNNASEWSAVNSIVASKDTIPPATVTGLMVTAGMKKVIISFDPVSDADLAGYEVHISTINEFTPSTTTLIASGLDTLYSYEGAVDTTYYVKVRSYDRSGNYSAYSAQASAKTMFVVTQDLADGIINTAKLAYDSVTTEVIATGAITSTELGAQAVTTAKIAYDAVTTEVIAANAVTVTEIADNAITSPKITAGAIVAGKIATDAVTANNIAANAITTAKLAVGAVTADTIAANAITTAKIDAAAITTAKLAVGAVTADAISANAITAGKIATGAVTAGAIAAGAVTSTTIQAGAITSDKLTTGELVTLSAQIKDAIITDAKINSLTASKITTGTLSASTSISVGDSKIKLDGTNSRITVANNSGTITDMVSVGKLGAGNYGISVKDKTGLQVFKVDENGATIQNLTAGTIDANKVTLQNLVVGNNVTMGPNAYISWSNVSSKPTIPTNTNQLTDGAMLGSTATWPNVTGTGKPADNANNTYVDSTGKIQGVSSGVGTVVSNPTAYSQTTAPSSPKLGDTWFNSATTFGNGYVPNTGYTYNGSSWVMTTPKGTYIDASGIYTGTLIANQVNTSGFTAQTANIANGAITNAQIANAAIDSAKIAQFIQSDNFQTGVSGWKINKDGNAEFSNVVVRGVIDATGLMEKLHPFYDVSCPNSVVTEAKLFNLPRLMPFQYIANSYPTATFRIKGSVNIAAAYPGSLLIGYEIIDANNRLVSMTSAASIFTSGGFVSSPSYGYPASEAYRANWWTESLKIENIPVDFTVTLMYSSTSAYDTYYSNGSYMVVSGSSNRYSVVEPLRFRLTGYQYGGNDPGQISGYLSVVQIQAMES